MINARKQTKFWPFKRSVLENFISFTSKPCTTENALLRFYTIQKKYARKKKAGSLVKEKKPSKLLQKLKQGGLKLGSFANPGMDSLQSCLNW